jgi:hypothetical protein
MWEYSTCKEVLVKQGLILRLIVSDDKVLLLGVGGPSELGV